MSTIIGLVVVFGCVLGGFAMAGGAFGVLVQPAELVVIGGATVGTIVISAPGKVLSRVTGALKKGFKSSAPTKTDYMDLLKLLYQILALIRREGVLALEPHVSDKATSTLFQNYPTVMHRHHAAEPLDASGATLAQALKSLGLPFVSTEDIGSEPTLPGEITPNTLGIGMGEAWSFSPALIRAFGGRLVDFMGIPHPRYRGGGKTGGMGERSSIGPITGSPFCFMVARKPRARSAFPSALSSSHAIPIPSRLGFTPCH